MLLSGMKKTNIKKINKIYLVRSIRESNYGIRSGDGGTCAHTNRDEEKKNQKHTHLNYVVVFTQILFIFFLLYIRLPALFFLF